MEMILIRGNLWQTGIVLVSTHLGIINKLEVTGALFTSSLMIREAIPTPQ